jgi:hypothetical protein
VQKRSKQAATHVRRRGAWNFPSLSIAEAALYFENNMFGKTANFLTSPGWQ